MTVTTLEPSSWTESEDWRGTIKPELHADFLKSIADAQRDGNPVKSVVVAGGVPIIYNISHGD